MLSSVVARPAYILFSFLLTQPKHLCIQGLYEILTSSIVACQETFEPKAVYS